MLTAKNKIICIGRNYADHATELNNPLPTTPVIFMKPIGTIIPMAGDVELPFHLGTIHHELELYIKLDQDLPCKTYRVSNNKPLPIASFGLALDLTLRDLQNELKAQGLPWERAKAFDHSCPLSEAIDYTAKIDLEQIRIEFYKNNQLCQSGSVKQMLFSLPDLIEKVNESFSLSRHDLILTGTPSGVSALKAGDYLRSCLFQNQDKMLEVNTQVV